MFSSGLIGRCGARATGPWREVASDSVRCVNGANEQNLPIRGRTVAWARANLDHPLNIAPGAIALLEGEPVGEERILEAGGVLEFLDPEGRKGVGRVWTIEQFCEQFQIDVNQLDHLLSLGLPHLRWPDGTLRIPEEQVDQFLNQHFGLVRRSAPLPPEYFCSSDAAAFLGVQPETLEHLRKSRKIRAIQVGDQRGFVYAVTDLRDFADSRTILTGEEERKKRGRR